MITNVEKIYCNCWNCWYNLWRDSFGSYRILKTAWENILCFANLGNKLSSSIVFWLNFNSEPLWFNFHWEWHIPWQFQHYVWFLQYIKKNATNSLNNLLFIGEAKTQKLIVEPKIIVPQNFKTTFK